MVRVIYLLAQPSDRRALLMESSVNGKKWLSKLPRGLLPTKKLLTFRSVFKAGLGLFINLAALLYISLTCMITPTATHSSGFLSKKRNDILQHYRCHHGGPTSNEPTFTDLVPYFPSVLKKITDNLECYLKHLESGAPFDVGEV